MPTVRRRYQVTETDDVTRALDLAAVAWPGESRAKLLLHVIGAGEDALREGSNTIVERRRQAIRSASGIFDGVYGANYLERLREDWPD
jgi:hypothetical protein